MSIVFVRIELGTFTKTMVGNNSERLAKLKTNDTQSKSFYLNKLNEELTKKNFPVDTKISSATDPRPTNQLICIVRVHVRDEKSLVTDESGNRQLNKGTQLELNDITVESFAFPPERPPAIDFFTRFFNKRPLLSSILFGVGISLILAIAVFTLGASLISSVIGIAAVVGSVVTAGTLSGIAAATVGFFTTGVIFVGTAAAASAAVANMQELDDFSQETNDKGDQNESDPPQQTTIVVIDNPPHHDDKVEVQLGKFDRIRITFFKRRPEKLNSNVTNEQNPVNSPSG